MLTVRQIAEMLGGTVEGDDSATIEGIASVETAGESELTFAADEVRASRLASSKAAAAIVAAAQAVPKAEGMTLIRVEDVTAAMADLLGRLAGPEDLPAEGVHGSAVVAGDAKVAPDAAIGPGVIVGARAEIGTRCALCANVFVGADVKVGAGSILFESVVVRYGCRIGSRVRIGPNSVIGYDGFGYYFAEGVHHKIPHIGNVVIADDVEIGACSCVDRAKFGSTRIGAGTKIDNLVQVAHNVQVGRGCILIGQCGIAGSAKLGDHVVIGGSAGIRDNVTLGEGVKCAAFAAVATDVPDGQIVAGVPAGPAREEMRIAMAQKQLPDLLKRVRKLQARLEKLESSKDH